MCSIVWLISGLLDQLLPETKENVIKLWNRVNAVAKYRTIREGNLPVCYRLTGSITSHYLTGQLDFVGGRLPRKDAWHASFLPLRRLQVQLNTLFPQCLSLILHRGSEPSRSCALLSRCVHLLRFSGITFFRVRTDGLILFRNADSRMIGRLWDLST